MNAARTFHPRSRSMAAVLVAIGFQVFGVAAQAAESAVGHVSLLIGEAQVVRKDGKVELLRRGSAIVVGDRVETAGNGHVHVRFIDNAAVSVRPDSVLEVLAYRFDAQNPQSNEVRLQLDKGAGRSISGRATELDKNRFRLNTPLAAIGVRGTDFIVQTNESGVRAAVNQGAIVVGAISSNCPASGLGPCGGGQSGLLSAEMGRWMIEVLSGEPVARLVPVSGALLAGLAPSAAEERMAAQRAAESSARAAGLLAAEPFRQNDRAAASALSIAAEGLPDLNSKPSAAAQLAWGRYSVEPPPHDNVSVPFVSARSGREAVSGNNDFTLFRSVDSNNPKTELISSGPPVSFQLSRAQATFEAGSRVEAASIDGGTLTLDFSRRSFATALALSSVTAGRAELRVAGDVRADGTFAVRDQDAKQYVAGSFTLDGKEAGYLFERGVPGGLFRGKTLWGR